MKKNTIVRINHLVLLILFFFFSLLSVSAQEDPGSKKNSVYGNFGTIIFSNQMSLSYERLLAEKKSLRTKAKVQFGHYLSNNADYDTNARLTENYVSLSAVQLISILEFNAGISWVQYSLAPGFDPDPDTNYDELFNRLAFYGNIGLRYTKDHFMIRAGLGNLELLYLGIGVNF